ncbi:hypothetical protein H257_12852 [Aphanomyces astaci]|uniref:Glycoside hydrolase n=1 Tax=Aphanomyces astaci TaxID=112090 RepID=W4FZ69_APHAT|nr:hypothetical protein H257_12852 [Aphanomyces astaci]ETV72059.1 hypothetical protein H257_12852 [Aphanomyces astaci]RQM30090.1 hypothetical protein B5M09_010799 [Aphanomyces astaci]|eukprot:XP_009838502.1 hypothetical protein H257_12852 [Aphanomyces astaci]
MMGGFVHSAAVMVAAATLYLNGEVMAQLTDLPLCRGNPVYSYTSAQNVFPELKNAIQKVSQNQVVTWWTDNNPDYYKEMQKLLNNCNSSTVPTIAVYGLPNKDCKAGFSNKGANKDADMYVAFIKELASLVGTRPVNYIMEPDGVGLALDAPCGKTAGYLDNMMTAIPMLTDDNLNASLYIDVGYWSLKTDELTSEVVQAVKQLASKGGNVRGIALGTSNYRKTSEMSDMCAKFVKASNKEYKCVIDTSRNYLGPKDGTGEWCNSRYAAIGVPPTSKTGNDLIDYFLWIKAPGESDGPCNTPDITADALKNGPAAGMFFEKAFSLMWDRGYFVDKKLGDKLGRYTLDVDQIQEGGGVSYVALAIVGAICLVLVIGIVFMKRRHDAKQGRARTNHRQVDAEAAVRKPYLSL